VDNAALKKKVASLGSALEVKQAMSFLQEIKKDLVERAPAIPVSSIFDRSIVFDEFEVLEAAISHIKRSAGIAEVCVVKIRVVGDGFEGVMNQSGDKIDMLVSVDKAKPGQPVLAFENI
jgi:hypothetical protein